jgi:hypothetical protein
MNRSIHFSIFCEIKESPVASEKCLGEGLGLSKIGTVEAPSWY